MNILIVMYKHCHRMKDEYLLSKKYAYYSTNMIADLSSNFGMLRSFALDIVAFYFILFYFCRCLVQNILEPVVGYCCLLFSLDVWFKTLNVIFVESF